MTTRAVKEHAGLLSALVVGLLWAFPAISGTNGADSIPSFAFALPASESFYSRDYEQALRDVLADTAIADTGIRIFKQAVAHFNLGNLPRALFCFRLASEKTPALAAVAYEYIGDISWASGSSENALHAYRVSNSSPVPPRYARRIRGKIYDVLKSDSTLASRISWFTETRSVAEFSKEVWLPDFFDTLLASEEWDLADSVIEDFLGGPDGRDSCVLFRIIRVHDIPDSVFPTTRVFLFSVLAARCGQYEDASDWLHRALKRKDFAKVVNDRKYLLHRARLNYRLGNYNKCIRWFDKYEKKYGLNPEVVLTVARSYRKLRKSAKAALWYDKHLEKFPNHPMTVDILWYRAWQKEDAGRYMEAVKLYTRMWKRRPRGSKADDAHLRAGLCAYKAKTYEVALSEFSRFPRKYPSSSLVTASKYWKGKSLLALKRRKESAEVFLEVAKMSPWNYYAHRSREMLVVCGDSSMPLSFDTTVGMPATRAWLESISEKEELSGYDSAYWTCGVTLALCGLTEQAELFLENFELDRPKDLSLQFDLATLYELGNDPTNSFRVGRRLTWRIPEKHRARLPLSLLAVMFPFPFRDHLVKYGVKYGVDPVLVCSVIRQESIFDPQIVSPAGAVGLMQIMPFTGKDVARGLGEEFAEDSLYNAETSIRYGTYYLKRLLDQFQDDPVRTLAGYNGGPHNAKRWHVSNRGLSFDLYVESIGFTETREYVKRVLANYWTYKAIGRYLGYYGT